MFILYGCVWYECSLAMVHDAMMSLSCDLHMYSPMALRYSKVHDLLKVIGIFLVYCFMNCVNFGFTVHFSSHPVFYLLYKYRMFGKNDLAYIFSLSRTEQIK